MDSEHAWGWGDGQDVANRRYAYLYRWKELSEVALTRLLGVHRGLQSYVDNAIMPLNAHFTEMAKFEVGQSRSLVPNLVAHPHAIGPVDVFVQSPETAEEGKTKAVVELKSSATLKKSGKQYANHIWSVYRRPLNLIKKLTVRLQYNPCSFVLLIVRGIQVSDLSAVHLPASRF